MLSFRKLYISNGWMPYVVALSIILGTLAAIFGIFQIISAQKDFELQRWKTRLGSSAGEMSEYAGDWFDARSSAVQKIASNPTVQIYFSELAIAGFDGSKVELGETKLGYVNSYLESVGTRAPLEGSVQLALLDPDRKVLAANQSFVPDLIGFDVASETSGKADLKIFDYGSRAAAQFIEPIYPLMSMAGEPVGYVVARVTLDEAFIAALRSKVSFGTAEFVYRVSSSPRIMDRDGNWRDPDVLNSKDVRMLEAAQKPGDLIGADDGEEEGLLAVSSYLPNGSMSLIASIPKDAALGGVNERLRSLLITLLFGLLAILALVYALWRHGLSSSSIKMAEEANRHALEIEGRERLLKLVADTYPGELVVVDKDCRIEFANARFAHARGKDSGDLSGIELRPFISAPIADDVIGAIKSSQNQNIALRLDKELESDGRFLSLSVDPIVGGDVDGAVLLCMNDITQAIHAKETRARLYWSVVDILLDAIDQRDPGAAAHSRRVAKLAADLMMKMGGDAERARVAEVAGSLLNVGKLFVPSDILTKSGSLSDAERIQITNGQARWLELISSVPFDLPIADVLMEARSIMSGDRTRALKSYLLAARVVVVANGYIALVSPRTYREPMSGKEALDELRKDRYMDNAIIAALDDVESVSHVQ